MTYYLAGIIREADGSGYSVYFPDVPNVAAGGESVEEALGNAASGLAMALRDLAERNAPIPAPSSMEAARAKVRAERELDGLPFPDDALFQYVAAPELDMAPVRVNITLPRAVLHDVDEKARLAGMTRSGFLAAAAQAYS